jgi:hypothetical protein
MMTSIFSGVIRVNYNKQKKWDVKSCFFLTCIMFHRLDVSPCHTKSLSLYHKICHSNRQQNGIYPAVFTQMLFNSNAKKKMFYNLYHTTSIISSQTVSGLEYITNPHPAGCITAYKYQLQVKKKQGHWGPQSIDYKVWWQCSFAGRRFRVHLVSTFSSSSLKMETAHAQKCSCLSAKIPGITSLCNMKLSGR